MKRIGVILSGCGHQDGAEIRESVLTLLALDKLGKDIEVIIMAPNAKQPQVINHLKHQAQNESRNILEESARIARGKILDIQSVDPDSLSAIIMPGGYGVARNLSNFAEKGARAEVLPAVKNMLTQIHQAKKPIGAICIAPALLALVLGEKGIKLTIGDDDPDTIGQLQETGAHHEKCSVDQVCVDEKNRIASTPAYMYSDAKLHHIANGIEKCVSQVLKWAEAREAWPSF
jgi:enhancing lycopene biosynthesis protein 2